MQQHHRITSKQQAAYRFIRDTIVRTGRPPTQQEVATHLDINKSTAFYLIKKLKHHGLITQLDHKSRGITLNADTAKTVPHRPQPEQLKNARRGPKNAGYHALPERQAERLELELRSMWWNGRCRKVRQVGLFISLGLYGLRREEIIRLQRRDLDIASAMLRVRSIKRGRPRIIPLHPMFAQALFRFGESTKPNAPLVPNRFGKPLIPETIYRASRRVLGKYGNYSMHSLRHTAALRTYDRTKDILEVMRLLGHRTLSVTHAYLMTHRPATTAGLPTWQHTHWGGRLRFFDDQPTPKAKS